MNPIRLVVPALAAATLASCTTSVVQTRESQAATTPSAALESLRAGNVRFASGHSLKRDLPAQSRKTAGGQHPIAAVLGCIDSRASHELVFDQGIGDIFSTRVAGNVVNPDVLGSLEFATAKAGAKAVVVLGHTRCGAVSGACSDARLGHVTGLLEKIKPAVRKVSRNPSHVHSGSAFEDLVTVENVRLVVSQLRSQSPVLADLEKRGKLVIRGAVYHLDTGRVEFLD